MLTLGTVLSPSISLVFSTPLSVISEESYTRGFLIIVGAIASNHTTHVHSLMGSGQFDKAAILSHDCSGVEASSPGFSVCARGCSRSEVMANVCCRSNIQLIN